MPLVPLGLPEPLGMQSPEAGFNMCETSQQGANTVVILSIWNGFTFLSPYIQQNYSLLDSGAICCLETCFNSLLSQ